MGLARQIRRLRKGKEVLPARKRRKALLESLEPRLLLDADLSFGMTEDANDLTLKLGKVGDVDELQIINTDTSIVLDSLALSGSTEVEIIGSDQDDVLRLDLDFDSLLDSLSIVFQGGEGIDTLDLSSIEANLAFVATQSGGVTVTDGEYTANEDGTVSLAGETSTTTGSGVENVIGGQGDNTYVFEDGAALVGTIDGGTGGNNSLDYSAYSISNPVVVDLSSGTATATGGVSRIHNVIGGSGDDTLTGSDEDNILSGGPGNDTLSGLGGEDILAGDEGEDTLIGPGVDTIWEITGANEGVLNYKTEFTSIENLTGNANNQDGFIFYAEGSISGIISGGEGGSDGFIIEDPGEEGPLTVVNPVGSGAGTVTLYGKTVNYEGMEPIVEAGLAGALTIHGSVYDDDLILEASSEAGRLQIRSLSGDFYDAASTSFISSLSFDSLTTSLLIRLGLGEDSLTIGAFDQSFTADTTFEGGAGFDQLVGADGINIWEITGLNAGTLNSQIHFIGIEDLTGGSAGDDFIFADGADVDGIIDGGSGGPNRLDYHLTTSDVTIAIGITVDNIDAFIGGLGSDTLYGVEEDSTWSITGMGAGRVTATDSEGATLLDAVFSGFENLGGRSGDDTFSFADGMGLEGIIDGGGGSNTLDYSAYGPEHGVSINLGSGGATGASRVQNIQAVKGGAGNDTLLGPEQTTRWNIDGANSGFVEDVLFATEQSGNVGFENIENLRGAANHEDGFIFAIGGSLSGSIDGGTGGRDAFAIEDPGTPGAFAVINPDASGNGVLHVEDLFPDDTRSVSYEGMEPGFLVDTIDSADVVISGFFFSGSFALEAGPNAGELQLRSIENAYLWNPGTGLSKEFTQVIDGPSESLTVRMGGASLIVNSLELPGADLIISCGDISFAGEILTHGADITVAAGNVTVNAGTLISTRNTLGDPVAGNSIGSSGDLAIAAKTIKVESGAKILTFDDLLSIDSDHIPSGIDNQSPAQVKWTPDKTYNSLPTISVTGGTGLTVDVVTDSLGNPTAFLRDRGTGYTAGEILIIEPPDEVGAQISVQVSGLLNDGGDISLTVSDRFQTWAYVPSDANAWVEIHDALLRGRNINIQSEADNDSLFDGEKNRAEEIGESAIDFLASISPFVGYAKAKASASVLIDSGTVIQSDADVILAAHSNSEANLMTLGIGASVAYARSEANATVTLGEGAAIHAAGGVLLKAETDNALTVTAMNMIGTTPDFMGKTLGDKAIPVHITFAWTEAYAHATTTVAQGAVITAGEYVDVQALNTKTLSSSSSGGGDFDALGAGVLVALSDSTADAVVNGSVTTARGNVSVGAKTEAEKNVTKAQSLVGSGWFEKATDYLSNASPKKFGIELFKAFSTWGYDKLKDKFDKPPENIEDIKTRPRSNTVTEEPTQRFSEKLSKFGGSVAFAWGEHSSSATAKIGGTAVVNAGGGVTVKSEVIERPDITAASVVGSAKDKNYKAKDNKKDVKKEYSGSIAVLVGDYTNTSTAVIEAGAVVDARGAIRVESETKIPYQDWLYNMKQTFGTNYTDLFSRIVSEDIGPNSFVTSWGLSAAEGKKAGVAGSANILLINNTATARIAEGALINQNIDVAGQDVFVTANNTFEAFNLVGTYSKILEKVKLDSKEGLKDQKEDGSSDGGDSTGLGGSFGGFFYTNTTTAAIESGALVNADSLVVDAQTIIDNVTLGVAGGNPGGTFGVNGTVTLVDMANNTLAKIDDGATVTADGAVKVTALDDVLNVNIVGGVSQGRSLGFGISAGIDKIERNTKAIIGNEEAVLGRGEFAPNTGVNDADNTIDLGYAHGFNTGDAVIYSNGGDDSIGGLVDGDTYYAGIINSRTVKLARSVLEANEDPLTLFTSAAIDDAEGAETINLGYNHGYQTGDAVVYRNGGGESIGGLNDGQTYYIIRISETEVRLAELQDDALSANPVPVDLDLSLGSSGTNHTLRLDLSPATSSGSAHSLGRAFDPSAAVSGEEGTINLGYVHGFANGERVTYTHGGGESIGGLENKGTYYVIVVNPTTIRLAESRWTALEGISLALDPSASEGTAHTIGVGFQPMPAADGATETLRFEGAHGFREGQALVYESGDGTPIGELTSGDTYYVNSINAYTIRLARSVLEAQEDGATLFSAGDLDNTGGSGTVIDLGYVHGFKTGDAVVYNNGGGESIGGLAEGQTYYVIRETDMRVKLADTAGGEARTFDPGTGSGAAHSLRLALDPSAATGTGHRLFEPDDVNGSLSSGGKTTVSATNTGMVVDVSLAASRTGDKASSKEEENAKEGKGSSGKYGVALSGSASANTVFDITEAYIADSVIRQSSGLEVGATESTTIVAISGAGALSTNQKGTFGLAGAVTVNWIDNQTRAYIHNSVLENTGTITVHSEATGRIIGIAAGLSGATRGTGIAGSVGVNLIFSDTDAYVDAGSTISGATSVSITAKDTSSIITVAGAIAFGGKAGVGAGVAVNSVDCSTDAYVADSDISTSGSLAVSAENDSDILAIAAAIGASKGTMAAAISVSVNLISNDAHAYLLGTKTDDGIIADGGISLTATDTSDIDVYAGGIALAFGKSGEDDKKKEGKSKAFTLGIAIAVNDIDNDVSAIIDGAKVSSAGPVSLLATSRPTIYALTIGGSVSAAVGKKGGLAFAGAGAGSGNSITNITEAAIKNGSTVETTGAGAVTLTATDTSKITADAGGVAIAIGAGGQESGAAISIGMSLAINEIGNEVYAVIDDSTVLSDGNVELTATSTATIDALTIGGTVAVGASGQKTGFAFAGAGAGSGNTIRNTIEAAIRNGSTVTTTGAGAVMLTAVDASTIIADAGGVGIAVGASGQGTGAALSIGVSIADNVIENKGKAYVDGSTVTSAGNIELTAVSAAMIDALTIAGAVGVGASATKGGYAGAGAGAASYNDVKNTVEAYIKNAESVKSTAGSLNLTAVDGLYLFDAPELQAADYLNDGTLPAAWRTAFAAPGREITFSDDVTVSVRAAGREWLVTDNDKGETYLIKKELDTYRVLKPTVITANGGGVAIGVGASGEGTGGALSVGVSLADNYINNTIRTYIDNSALPIPGDTSVSAAGDIALSATSMAEIDALTIGGAIAVGASGGGSGYAGAGTGAAAYNKIENTIESFIKGVGSITSENGDLTLTATDSAAIVAYAIGGSIAVGASGTSTGGALSIGVSIAHNTISNKALAYIDNSALAGADNTIVLNAEDVSLIATSMDTIDALSIAASIAVGASAKTGVALSGGGSESTNIILTKTNAYILDTDLETTGDVVLEARNTSDITAKVITGSLSVGAGGTTGVAASVGASLARNLIGWDADGIQKPAEVQAYVKNSSIDTQGDLILSALANETIDAVVVSGSVAISAAGTTGVGLSGSGADGENKITTWVKAFIEGDGGDGAGGIVADSISLTALDSSTITADVAGGSLAGAFAGTTGVSLSIGVALAYNEIRNDIAAYIKNADTLVESLTGGISLSARETATITALSIAASASIAIAGTTGIALSGAGAETTNVILTWTNAYVENSTIISAGDVALYAGNTSTITATIITGTLAAGIGGTTGVGASIGASLARNLIGWDSDGVYAPAQVQAYVKNSSIDAEGDLIQTAVADETIDAVVVAGSVAISGGGTAGVGLSGSGADAENRISTQVKAFIDGDGAAGINAENVTLTALDLSDIRVDVGAGSLAASFAGTAAVSLSIGVALAENSITNQVEAYIANADSVTATDGSITIQALEGATVDALSVATSLAASFSGGVGVALSGAGSDTANTIANTVKAYISDSTVTTMPMTFNYTQQDNPTKIVKGERVRLDAGGIYEYVGEAPLEGDIDLAEEDYTVASLWKQILYTQEDTPAQVAEGDRVQLESGDIYEYVGATPLTGPVDLDAQTFTNTTLWKPINDVVVDALSVSTVTALGGAASAAVSGGQVAASGSVGVALLDNLIANQVTAFIQDSTVFSADDLVVRAKAMDTIDAVGFSGSVALAGGPGGALSGTGVEVTNILMNGVNAYLSDTVAVALDDIDVQALSDSDIVKSQAIGVAVAASLGAASAGASIVDNQIRNTVQAYVTATEGKTIDAWGDVSILADVIRARMSDVTATTVSVTAGVVGLSGGGIDIDNTIANTVNAFVSGPIDVTADGDVSVVASEDAYIIGDATAVSVSVSLGAGIGVALVENEVSSTIQAWVQGATITSDNTLIHADSVADVAKTISCGVSGSAILGAQGNEATANIKTLVKAYAENATLNSTHDVAIQATSSNIANTNAKGGAFGAIAVGAMVSDINLGAGHEVYEVEATVGSGTTVHARTLRIMASSSEDLLAESTAGGGGAVAAAGAESDVTSDQATMARIGAGAQVEVSGLVVNSLHTQDVDTSADSYAFAAAAGSGAGVSSTITTKANVDIGAGATVNAGNILINAKNELTKDDYKDSSNLRSGSASLGNVTVLLSETDIGEVAHPFEAVVTIGNGAKLTVAGDNQNPGVLKIEALNKIAAFDSVRIESVSGFGVSTGISRVESDTLASINLNGAVLESKAGDVYLTAKTDSTVSSSANLFVATALTGGAGAEATTTTKAANQINMNGGAIKGSDVYLYAGRDSSEVPNLINAFANVELTAISMLPNIAVPIPTVDIQETNTVSILGTSPKIQALEDVNLVTDQGMAFRQTDGLALSLSLIPYGFPIPGYGAVASTNLVTIGEGASIEAGINNQAILLIKPVTLLGDQTIDLARLDGTPAERLLTNADKLKEAISYVFVSDQDVVEVVAEANKGGVTGNRYAYQGDPDELVLSEEDYSDGTKWADVTSSTTEDDVTYSSDYVTDVEYEYFALNAREIAFTVYTGTVIHVVDDDPDNPFAGNGEIDAFYRYRIESDEPARIVLNEEDFTNQTRWEKLVVAYDLNTLPEDAAVAIQKGQIVRTTEDELYAYLGADATGVKLHEADFSEAEKWGQIGPDVYKSDVTLASQEALENKFYAVKPTRVEAPTLTLQNVGQLLLAQREQILDWMANHSSNPEAVARYEIELALLEETLVELGLMEVYEDTATGEKILVANEGLNVLFVELPNIYAAPGSIFINADAAYQSGFVSLVDNQLIAKAGAKISVFNETPLSMTVSDMVIRDTKKVTVVDGDYTVLSPGNVYFNNKGLTTIQDAPIKKITIIQDAVSQNSEDYGLEEGILPENIGQDMYILGDVINEVGDVAVINNEGSINVSGEIRAENVDIDAAQDFNLNTEDWFHVMDPRQYPGLDAYRKLVFNQAGTLKRVTYPEDVNPFESVIDPRDGGVLSQGRVAVTARYLNINGVIQSGVQTITLHVDESFKPSGTTSFLDDDGDPIAGISFGMDGVPVDGYFDAQKQAIVVDEIVPKGGRIDLAGQILSTGSGMLRVAYGYTGVDIQNDSSYDLILNRIDTTTKRDGLITITDTARLQKVIYEVDGEQVKETLYEGTSKEDPDSGRSRIVYEEVGSEGYDLSEDGSMIDRETGEIVSYEPREGLQYVWTEGQEKTTVIVTYYKKRSFNLIGFDWDSLAKDENYEWRTINYRDAYPLLESEILAVDPNYTEGPDTTVVTLEMGQTVKTYDEVDKVDRVYMYQGPTAEIDLSTADYTDAAKWVEVVETPSYADDKSYTVQFELRKDTDVELYQDVSIIKVVNDANGVLMAKGGVVGHRYLYLGDNAELVLRDQNYSDQTQWTDVTTSTTDTRVTYNSDFLNYSFQVQTWQTGGGWLRYKTIHMLTTQIFGQKDYYTHTLRADYPVDVQFLRGSETPSISVETKQDLYLQGTITSPGEGTVSLVSTAGSVIFGDEAAVLGVSPTIQAAKSVRANVEGGKAPDAGPALMLMAAQNDSQVRSITSNGDIELRVVYDPEGNQSSTLVVGQVISTGGNVILHAGDGIQPFDASSLVKGNRIELYTRAGDIGSEALPLQVDSDVLGSGGVAARAYGDIFIQEMEGDLKLSQPQSWEEVQASIHSETGDAILEAVDGAILDAFYEEFRPRTQEEAEALDQELQLTGQKAQAAAEASIRAEENTQTQLYHAYWETYRDAKPGDIEHEMTVETIDAGENAITFSQAHGLETGDQVFFSVGMDLGDEEFDDTSLWEEIVPDYDLQTVAGTVSLGTGQIVRTNDGALYQYLGEDDGAVDLGDEEFDDAGRWAKMVPDYDLEDLEPGVRVMLQTDQMIRTSDGTFHRYQGESATMPYANLDKGVAYYAVVMNETAIQLALSRYDAAISETPLVLDIKIEGSDEVVLQENEADFGHVNFLEFGYTYDDLAEGSTLEERYQKVHDTYGGGAYDPNFIYQISDQERQERIADRTFSSNALRYQISQSLFSFLYPDAEGGGVEAPAETPNVIANHLMLKAGGQSGQIGRVTGVVTIDLSGGFENLPIEHQEILTYAGVGDVVSVTYDPDDPNQIQTLTLQVWNDVDVEAPDGVNITAGAGVALETEGDLVVNSVAAGGDVRLVAGGAVIDPNAQGTDAAVSTDGNLSLRAGTSVEAVNGVDPFRIHLYTPGKLSAEVTGDLNIEQVAGDLSIGKVYATKGSVTLRSAGSIYDGAGNDEVKVKSLSLYLNAAGAIGEAEDFLEIDQIIPDGQGSIGEAKIQAGGHIFLRDPADDFYVDEIRSTGGDVSLEAAVSILDAAGDDLADVIGRSISLSAKTGGIGLSLTGDLDVNTDSSISGVLTAYSALNAYLFEVDDDLLLKEVGTDDGHTAFILSPGKILNGNSGGTNIISGATRLYAASDIGAEGNPLRTAVDKLEVRSETGDVWISNTGPLIVGGVSDMEGIFAGGALEITASSPVTVEERIEAEGDIIIEAVDDAEDGPGETDDILVPGGVTIWSKEGKVSLRAGDDPIIEEGAIIKAATVVELFGDYGNADAGGTKVAPHGEIDAPLVRIFGEADNDLFDLRDVSVPADVSGGDGIDTLMGPDQVNSWVIDGPNTGLLNEVFTFKEVENLTGGTGDDTFYFRGQGSVDGLVDGGAGWDILDFLKSDFIQEAAADFLVTELPIGDEVVPFIATGGITRIEDIRVILLAEVQEDGTLVLNMGPRAAERLMPLYLEDIDEEFLLHHIDGGPADLAGETIAVSAFGFTLEYEGVRAILGWGGQGNDKIILAGDVMAPAELDGGPGNDFLVGGAGADVLRGGVGNDTLEGGAGDDVMDGGWGDDRYVIVPGSLDKVIDVQGVDTLDFSGALLGVRVDLNKAGGQIQKIDSAGNKLRIYGMIENAVGSEFNDWIYGNRLNNTLEGLEGDDWLFGSYGNDRLAGGAGKDYIEGGCGEDLLFFPGAVTGVTVNLTCGGNGWSTDGLGGVDNLRRSIEGAIGTKFDDTLVGDDSRNVSYGMAGDDFIDGRGGDDVLYGGEGVDRIFAGWGNDLVVWNEGEGNDTIDMGDGWDRVRITTGDSDDRVYLSSPAKNNVMIEGAGSTVWSLSVTKGDIFELYTGGGHDIVTVGNLKRTDVDEVVLYLGSGNDKVDGTHASGTIRAYGQAGNDLFIGGWGKDTFDGGEGSDWVDYSSAPRRVHVDLAWGASRDGKGSKDCLKSIENVIGTQFDDMIWGTDGANIIIALGGNDHVWARGGDDVVYGGAGDDKLWGDGGNDTLMGDAGNDMVWGGQGDDRLYGGSGNDRLRGEDGDDELFGDDGDDRLEGGDGDDRLEGGDGHDELDGGWGNDQLFGGTGNDRLEGGHGDDLLKGESGNDTLDGGWGNDRLYGGDGDDRLYGGWGDDELFGEDGNDLLVGDHGDDKLDGGAGVNKLVDWPDKQKDCGGHGHGPFDKPTVSPCSSWVNSFVTDLCGDHEKDHPNGKIKITLPVMEEKKRGK